jgi:hypothetical protein
MSLSESIPGILYTSNLFHSKTACPKTANNSDCLKDSSLICRVDAKTPHVQYSYLIGDSNLDGSKKYLL